MKITWEAEDIRPGRLVQKQDCGITGRHKIGYRIEDNAGMPNIFGLVSMADGMFMQYGTSGTKAELAACMNSVGYYMPVELIGATP